MLGTMGISSSSFEVVDCMFAFYVFYLILYIPLCMVSLHGLFSSLQCCLRSRVQCILRVFAYHFAGGLACDVEHELHLDYWTPK